MENVTVTQKEQARLQVLNNLLAGHTTLDQAATLMGVTTRHTRRILAAYREKGVRELGIHRATIKKYLEAEGPPTQRSRAGPTTPSSDTMAAQPSDIYAGRLNGHFP